tara:strand:+ start:336 stop:572 length:237 start_codon:yes stop_codon:yes gene_type:complete
MFGDELGKVASHATASTNALQAVARFAESKIARRVCSYPRLGQVAGPIASVSSVDPAAKLRSDVVALNHNGADGGVAQ